MTIFHVIKYSDVDIYEQTQLDQLPKKVIEKWRWRLIEYSIHQTESIIHLDTTGMARPCIDAAKKFRRGEISKVELNKAAEQAWLAAGGEISAWSCASQAAGAAWAAGEMYWTAQYAESISRVANCKDMLYKWLIEELNNYEMTS